MLAKASGAVRVAAVDRALRAMGMPLHGRTIVAPFSARPLPGAPASCPLQWEQVTARLDPRRFKTDLESFAAEDRLGTFLERGFENVQGMLNAAFPRLFEFEIHHIGDEDFPGTTLQGELGHQIADGAGSEFQESVRLGPRLAWLIGLPEPS